MLCLSDIIRDHEPSLQPLLCAVEEAPTLTALLVAVWPLARVLALHVVEYVLAERARRPTAWPPCPVCGACLRSKGLVKRQVTSLFGPLQWRRRVGRCPQGCHIPSVVPLDAELEVPPSQRTSGELRGPGVCLGRVCAVCHGGDVARLVQRAAGEPSGGVGMGASGGPAGHGHAPGAGGRAGHGGAAPAGGVPGRRACRPASPARGRWSDGARAARGGNTQGQDQMARSQSGGTGPLGGSIAPGPDRS